MSDLEHTITSREKIRIYKNSWAAKPENKAKRQAYANGAKEEKRVYDMAYREKNKDIIRQKKAQYRAENVERIRKHKALYREENKEKIAKHKAEYSKVNSQKIAEKCRQYYHDNWESRQENGRRWRANNPEKARYIGLQSTNRRRARKNAAKINDFTHAQWKEIQEAYDHRCVYCKKRRKGRLTQDHITPLSKGGSHTASNIVPACKSCNCRKHVGPPLTPVQPLLLTLAPSRKATLGLTESAG